MMGRAQTLQPERPLLIRIRECRAAIRRALEARRDADIMLRAHRNQLRTLLRRQQKHHHQQHHLRTCR